MVFWMMQGATAENPVDGHVTTYANYIQDFGQIHSLMAGLGIGWPWYVSRTTYALGVTKADVRQAQSTSSTGRPFGRARHRHRRQRGSTACISLRPAALRSRTFGTPP